MTDETDRPRIRIVLADDHAIVRQGTAELLSHEGDFEVVGAAADGEEAIGLVRTLRPDVAILDIAMPRLNGIAATRTIKQEFPQTRVLILTAFDDEEYVLALVEAGVAGYVLKTANYAQLISAVRGVYEGEAVLDQAVAQRVWSRLRTTPKAGARASSPSALSEREHEVVALAAKGLSNKEIARELTLSWRTVQAHLQSAFSKLGVASRTEAVVKGLQEGWLHLTDTS